MGAATVILPILHFNGFLARGMQGSVCVQYWPAARRGTGPALSPGCVVTSQCFLLPWGLQQVKSDKGIFGFHFFSVYNGFIWIYPHLNRGGAVQRYTARPREWDACCVFLFLVLLKQNHWSEMRCIVVVPISLDKLVNLSGCQFLPVNRENNEMYIEDTIK